MINWKKRVQIACTLSSVSPQSTKESALIGPGICHFSQKNELHNHCVGWIEGIFPRNARWNDSSGNFPAKCAVRWWVLVNEIFWKVRCRVSAYTVNVAAFEKFAAKRRENARFRVFSWALGECREVLSWLKVKILQKVSCVVTVYSKLKKIKCTEVHSWLLVEILQKVSCKVIEYDELGGKV